MAFFGKNSSKSAPPREPATSADKDLYEIPPLPQKEAPEIPPEVSGGVPSPSPDSSTDLLPEIELPPEPEPVEIQTISLGISSFNLDDLLKKCLELSASDVHLEVGAPPVYRIHGEIVFTDIPPLTHEQMETLSFPLMNDVQCKAFHESGNMDLAYEIPGVARYRVNLLKQYRGVGAIFRIIPEKMPTIEELGLPQVLKKVCMASRGIVIVTGPTGSGKSTTMAAMINYINHNRKAHIITIEDPIEFTHNSLSCLIDHREVGHHTKSFADALRAAIREDPNIVLVGEMRDLETTSLAITAAEMGVLVFGTLHTNSAAKTVDRIIDIFPAKQQEQVRSQLSGSLRAIIAQQLLRKAEGKGRVAAIEILLSNTGLANLIREGKNSQIPSFMQMGISEGMQTMDMALISLVREGKIKLESALARASDLTTFKRAGMI